MRQAQGNRFSQWLPLPGEREAKRRAAALQQADAGALLALAILSELDLEARKRVASRLEALARKGAAHRTAADLAATQCLNFGELGLLLSALAPQPE